MNHLMRLSALVLLLSGATNGLTSDALPSPGVSPLTSALTSPLASRLTSPLASPWAESTDTIKPGITATPEQVKAGLFFQGQLVVLRANAPASNPAIIIVSGPRHDRQISKKTRQTGIWLNGPSAELQNAPGYLAVFSSGPVGEFNFGDQSGDQNGDLTDLLGYLPDDMTDPEQTPTSLKQWRHAYGRLLKARNLLINQPEKPLVGQHNQFFARLMLPSSAPTGKYQVTLVTQNDSGFSRAESQFEVVKVGLVKQLEQAAFTQPVLYGVGSLLFALLFGWLVGTLFNRR